MPELKSLDAEHFYVNEYLVDLPLIWAWYNSRIWADHSPLWFVKQLEKRAEELAQGKDFDYYSVMNDLSAINNKGYYVPDEAFKGSRIQFARNMDENRVGLKSYIDIDIKIGLPPKYQYYVIE